MEPEEKQKNVELDAVVQNGVDTNSKLDSIEVTNEAQVVEQQATTKAVKDVEVSVDANTKQIEKGVNDFAPSLEAMAKAQELLSSFVSNLTGPEGKKGDKGDKGDKGEDAHKTGPRGLMGPEGPEGPMGKTGPQGPMGKTGPKGLKGDQGPAGKPGKDAPVKSIIKETTETVSKEVLKQVDKDIDSVQRHVASKSYAMRDLTDTQTGTTGQIMMKQADGSWAPATAAGTGDMLQATYDPTSVAGDAFDTDNHVDGTTNKVYTATEKTKLGTIEESADVTDEANVTDALDGATLSDIGTPASGDLILLQDASDSNNLKVAQFSTFAGGGGGGDVTKVGTPVDSQIGVWTGDGTIEGASSLTYNGSNLQLTGDIGSTGTRITKGWFTDLQVTNAIAGDITGNSATVTNGVYTTDSGTVFEPAKGADDNYVTDAEKVVIGNTSGTNTGDMSNADVKTAYEANANTNAYTDAEKTKLTGISQGIANGDYVGINSTTVADNDYAKFTSTGLEGRSYAEVLSDIGAEPAKGSDDNYVTDAEKVVIGNTSGTNSGDEPDASDTVKGIVELATNAEVTTGTDTARAVTPAGAKVELDKKLALSGGTMTGDIQLGETDIKLDATLSGDEKWSGIVVAGTLGSTVATGEVCFLASDGKWDKVDGIQDGTDTGFNKQLGICLDGGNDTDSTEMLLYGKVRSAEFPAFTVGSPVYLSDTAGDLTTTAPSTTNHTLRIVGFALSAEELMFNPSNDWVVHA